MLSIEQVAAIALERGISYGRLASQLWDEREPKAKPVIEYDKDGKDTAEYASVAAAGRATGRSVTEIRNHCKSRVTYRFLNGKTSFRYKGDPIPKGAIRKRAERQYRLVEKYDSSGKVIAVYTGPTEAAKANGIAASIVSADCRGISKRLFCRRPYAFRYGEVRG